MDLTDNRSFAVLTTRAAKCYIPFLGRTARPLFCICFWRESKSLLTTLILVTLSRIQCKFRRFKFFCVQSIWRSSLQSDSILFFLFLMLISILRFVGNLFRFVYLHILQSVLIITAVEVSDILEIWGIQECKRVCRAKQRIVSLIIVTDLNQIIKSTRKNRNFGFRIQILNVWHKLCALAHCYFMISVVEPARTCLSTSCAFDKLVFLFLNVWLHVLLLRQLGEMLVSSVGNGEWCHFCLLCESDLRNYHFLTIASRIGTNNDSMIWWQAMCVQTADCIYFSVLFAYTLTQWRSLK